MTERIRLIVDTEDVVRRAVHLRRLKLGSDVSVSDVVNDILRQALATEIAEVEKFPAVSGEAPRAKRSRKKGGNP